MLASARNDPHIAACSERGAVGQLRLGAAEQWMGTFLVRAYATFLAARRPGADVRSTRSVAAAPSATGLVDELA